MFQKSEIATLAELLNSIPELREMLVCGNVIIKFSYEKFGEENIYGEGNWDIVRPKIEIIAHKPI